MATIETKRLFPWEPSGGQVKGIAGSMTPRHNDQVYGLGADVMVSCMMMPRILLVMAVLVLGTIEPALAGRRLALVIGNDAYPNLGATEQLHNAVNDARAMQATLKSLGFDVAEGENLTRADVIGQLSDFAARLESDDIAFFFYAGHGVALNGQNFLVPSDIPAPRASGRGEEQRLADLAVSEATIIDRMNGVQVAVVVLDSCRDNPLKATGGRSIGAGRGLVRPPDTRGLLSIYSAGIGQEALDRLGDGDPNANSVFTRVFVEKLQQPGIGLREAAFQTQSAVAALAKRFGQDQVPGIYSQILGNDVVLDGSPKSEETPEARAAGSAEQQAFLVALQKDDIATLDAFLTRYPRGPMADLARRERERQQQIAQTAEPQPPQSDTESKAFLKTLPRHAVHALVMGFDAYFPKLPLTGSRNDAADIASVLRQRGVTDITVLDEQSGRLADVERAWAALKARAQPGDVLFVSFSGQGNRVPEVGEPKHHPDGFEKGFLLPRYDEMKFPEEQLRDEHLYDLFKAASDQGFKIIFVADAGHSGAAVRGLVIKDNPAKFQRFDRHGKTPPPTPDKVVLRPPIPGLTIYSAADESQSIQEFLIDDQKRGALSYALARGLEGDAADPDGRLTEGGLGRFIVTKVRALSSNTQIPSAVTPEPDFPIFWDPPTTP